MKNIGSVKEDLNTEKRISITPETVKKFISEGFSVNIEKKYGEHLGIKDEDYKKNGANINITKEEVFEKSDIILKKLRVNGKNYGMKKKPFQQK